jgi:hypothetical protein
MFLIFDMRIVDEREIWKDDRFDIEVVLQYPPWFPFSGYDKEYQFMGDLRVIGPDTLIFQANPRQTISLIFFSR